ncbi:TetR family transcriptional regulator [Actinoplanes sp. ATCC 53533]|uniref:TetR/AcrR family transcriptional regulator n=1 Tax=Actinoplanes sp. ATCC 53533 TaxID=1288362 RepID=UPI000F76E9C7|nr:TetR/AcrR family transcriptional regulator [Actinoplanes sp. ATCC 53533]RSM69895.1 TetR family transcriptional regulator [Actinoplanes sp. ATCC 53533]
MAPTTSAGSLRADSARARARVLAAAREALAAGDTDLAMNAIAKAAGVGVGTVYRHFPSRQALLESLATASFAAMIDDARAAAAEPDAAAGLARLLRSVLRFQLTDPSLAAVLATPSRTGTEAHALSAELLGTAMAVVDRARAAGVIRPEVTADDLRRLICGVHHAVRLGADDSAADRYLEILVSGLRP